MGGIFDTLSAALNYALDPRHNFLGALGTHLRLSATALFLAALVGIPAGIIISRYTTAGRLVVNFTGVIRVVPSLAVLFLLLPLLRTGFTPAVVALTLLAIPPLLINTDAGMRAVDTAIIEAGRGMGMSYWQMLGRVQVPLALPVIVVGLRAATVEVIASATLASLIGAGGLGDYISIGLSTYSNDSLLAGAIPVAVLALAAELLLSRLQRRLSREGTT